MQRPEGRISKNAWIQPICVCAPQSATPTSSSAIKDGLTYGRGLICSLLFAFAYKQLRCLLHGSASERDAGINKRINGVGY